MAEPKISDPVAAEAPAPPARRGWLAKLGPGIVGGAANDDPSCIVTYSIAGASFGYLTLWTSLYSLPAVAAVQLMSARLGLVSGRGLAGAVRVTYPAWVLYPTCVALFAANLATIGADLGGMGEVTELITGVSGLVWTPLYAALITGLLFYLPYRRIERVLRWLCLVLFAYVIAGLLSRPDWDAVLAATVLPRGEWSGHYLSVIVAILGATVSPYFLFWQAAQEVEEEYSLGRHTVAQRRGASREDLERSQAGVFAGSLVSKLITYAITLTTAATLFAHGNHDIGTAADAAAALAPIAGPAASWLFAVGVIGTGMLAIPVLAGSSAHAVSEALRWRASLQERPRLAPKFYAVVLASTLLGLALIYAGVGVVQMLFWASVLNGLLAPLAILLLLLLTHNPRVMGRRRNPPWLTALGCISLLLTAAAALGMVASFLV